MNRRGYTLIEVLLVLMLSTLLLAITVAPARHARSVLAVRAARSDIAALVAVTRSTAVMTGGATLVVDVGAGTAWIEQGSGVRVGDVQHIGAREAADVLLFEPAKKGMKPLVRKALCGIVGPLVLSCVLELVHSR